MNKENSGSFLPIAEGNLGMMQSMLNREVVENAIQKTYSFEKLMSYYRCAMMELETKFNVLNEEFSLQYDRQPIITITSRLKNPLSIFEKMSKKGMGFSIDDMEKNINDIAGIRVVCSFIEDTYMLYDALKKQDDVEILNVKDYIRNPKPNGYRSLHLIVSIPIFLQEEKRIMKAEIQLRTIAMDSWASLEHQLRYKKDKSENSDMMAKELALCAQLSEELDERMNNLCLNVLSKTSYESGSEPDIYEMIRGML